MTFDEKLTQALKESFEERVEQSMSSPEKHRFSLSYRLWERKMLRDLRRDRVDKRWTLQRARYAVTAMFAAFSLLIGGTAYAAIVISRGFIIKDNGYYEDGYYIDMLIEKSPSEKSTFEEYYGLPEEDGWVLKNHYFRFEDTELFSQYRRGDTAVAFYQMLIPEMRALHINLTKGDVEMWSFYSENDGFVVDLKNNRTEIYWLYDGYLLRLLGNVDKNEMIKLVYSTKIVDFQNSF